MNIINFALILFIYILIPAEANANEFRISYISGGFFSDNLNAGEKNLQVTNDSTKRLEFDFLRGTASGLLLGFVYGHENMEYKQNTTDERVGGSYKSSYIHTNLKFGYWFLLNNNIIIESYGGVGLGKFNFKNMTSGPPEHEINDVKMIEATLKGIIPMKIESVSSIIDLQFGATLYQALVPGFSYEGMGINQNDYQRKNFFRFLLGIGIRF